MGRQRIRDPLHNLIEFEMGSEFEHTLWRVIQTRPFQRLRRVKQLGFSDLVYPGATHSRLAHSVGVFHTARRLMSVIGRSTPRPEQSKVNQALAAALVHDLGHGPFSHAFEAVGKRLKLKAADHEFVSDALIRDSEVSEALQELGSGFANDVADIIKGVGKKNMYRAVVSSQFDADRLDYMRRDRLMTGTQHAAIDFEWLIANLEVGSVTYGVDESSVGNVETFVLGPKAIHAAEAYVLGLFQLYPTVYFHKTTRGAEKLFTEVLSRLVDLVKADKIADTGLPSNHPLIRFARYPDEIKNVLNLDDTIVWGALSLMVDASDEVISKFSLRLRDRRLFRCIDIRVDLGQKYSSSAEGEVELDKVCTSIKKRLESWSEDPKNTRKILIDEAVRSPYKTVDESEGPLGQINIRNSFNKLVDLKSQSAVVDAVKPFKLFRVYLDRDDHDTKRQLDGIIESETTK